MAQLTWVSPAGSIANLPIGLPVYLQLIAVDTTNNGSQLTYSVIGGELPPGMELDSATGIISGTPEYSTNNYFTTLNYDFIVRVSTSNPITPADRKFTILITNTVNSDFTWITPAGSLGTVPNGEFYQLPLEVSEIGIGVTTKFSFVSGELPPGMQIVSTGFLQGVPTLLTSNALGTEQTFRFTIRATSSVGHIRDRAFNLNVTNVYGPVIEPTVTNLGSYFDGKYYSQQLTVAEPNPSTTITWSNIGNLPPGITLSSTGLLSGYIKPLVVTGVNGPSGYDGESVGIFDTQFQGFNNGPYDFGQTSESYSYSFTIRAFDGANYDLQNYIINVISRTGYTADSDQFTTDNTYLTVDATNTYTPILLNNDLILPPGRGGSYYAFKFNGYDFQGDRITYSLSNTVGTFDAYVPGIDAGFDFGGTGTNGSDAEDLALIDVSRGGIGFDSFTQSGTSKTNLPGLILDAQTGWVYGQLTPQDASYTNYRFGVIVTKVRDGIEYSSIAKYFTLPVLGDVNNVINWVTPEDLGSIDNGSLSEIALEAVSIEGNPLVYTLLDAAGIPIRLPQGLQLITTKQNNKYLGLLSGRVTFETFSLDKYSTTFDGSNLTIDHVYKFTVQVATDDAVYNADGSVSIPPSSSSTREFTLAINIIDKEPYNNLYLQALPAWDQRQIFNSVINNKEIFVPELIYRPNDPWYGVSKDIEMLFLPGLNPDDLNTYANVIMQNHYTKTYTFGNIGTAVVLDENYNVKYEVVYVNVKDPEENNKGVGPATTLDLTNTIANPYIDANGNEYKIIYPNTSNNMVEQLIGSSGVGYYDQSSLPKWMTSNQPIANSNKFNPPLGFTKAVVLAYTIPGASKLIAYRLQNSGINFNRIDFTVDRYIIDNFYTTNFDTTNKVYELERETTFDVLPNRNVGTIVTAVNYAATIPFNQINGRPLSAVVADGGIDGVTTFKDGDTMIFAKQENFLNPGPYQGWVNYTDAYIGDNILTRLVEGYDINTYDTYHVVPGYLENSQSTVSVLAISPAGFPGKIQVDNSSSFTIGQKITFSGSSQGGLLTNGTPYYIASLNQQSITTNVSGVPSTTIHYYVGLSLSSDLSTSVPLTTVLSISLGNLITYSIANERGGVWKINIIDGFVVLTPFTPMQPGQRLRVLFGNTYGGSIMYYNPILNIGQTVPSYAVYKLQTNIITKRTTFNGDTTRFFNYRDQYYTPGAEDQYLKFQQYGMFI